MPEELRFNPYNFKQEIRILHEGDPVVATYKPKWWRRLFLGEKVKTMRLSDVCAELGKSARRYEEQLMKELYNNAPPSTRP